MREKEGEGGKEGGGAETEIGERGRERGREIKIVRGARGEKGSERGERGEMQNVRWEGMWGGKEGGCVGRMH